MNRSQLEHFILIFCAMALYGVLPNWLYALIASLLIELDQARNTAGGIMRIARFDVEVYGGFWDWFKLRDTWLDLAADTLAIGCYLLLRKLI